MARPPFNKQTPIGALSGGLVRISAEFARWLEEVIRLSDADAVVEGIQDDIDTLDVRLDIAENGIQVNTNNIASIQMDLSQAQTDVATLQGEMVTAQTDIQKLRDEQFMPVRIITGEY